MMEITETPAVPHAEWAAIELERRSHTHLIGNFSAHDMAPIDAALWRNNCAYEAAVAAMTSDYPPSEIATWERQREEALAWHADSTAATPWIDVAATERQIPRGDYLSRTYAKAAQFAQASAYLTGHRQAIDDLIKITPADQLRAIVISYALPGAQ